jgi:hypothetical protein
VDRSVEDTSNRFFVRECLLYVRDSTTRAGRFMEELVWVKCFRNRLDDETKLKSSKKSLNPKTGLA